MSIRITGRKPDQWHEDQQCTAEVEMERDCRTRLMALETPELIVDWKQPTKKNSEELTEDE